MALFSNTIWDNSLWADAIWADSVWDAALVLLSDGELGPDVTLTRTTAANYWDSSGVLRTAAINEPRIDYNPADGTLRGLLIEETRTNKCRNFNLNPDAALTNISASAGTLDRVNDAANIPFDGETVGGNVFHLNNATGSPVTITVTGTTANTNKHSIRVFARFTGTAPTLQLTGAVGAVACANNYAETRSDNITPSATSNQWQLVVPNGTTVWFLGNQLEEGAFCTSPIETTGAAAARDDADNVTAPITTPLPAEFSIVVEATTAPGTGYQRLLSYDVGSAHTRFDLFRRGGVDNIEVVAYVNGAISLSHVIYAGYPHLAPLKIALSVTPSGIRVSLNGGAEQTVAGNIATGAFSHRRIGQLLYQGQFWGGWIKNFTEIPRALSDTELVQESGGVSPHIVHLALYGNDVGAMVDALQALELTVNS